MRAVPRPFWLNALRELRQPLAALASLLVIINLATATAAAHPGAPWASLCIGSGTLSPAAPDGDTAPATTCQHCCFATKAQPAPSGPTIETPALQGARFSAELREFAHDLQHDPSLFGPRGPPESV